MSLGQAFDDADELLTLLALISVLIGLLVFVNNIGNPSYDAIQAFNNLIANFAHALVPNIRAIIVVGIVLWFIRYANEF